MLAAKKLWKWLAALWLIFTLSLAAWWLVFGLQQIDRLHSLDHSLSGTLVNQQRMLLGEGSMLLLVVLLGGAALIYLSYQAEKRREEMQHFLSGFTHELKTSLASLRLQSEVLIEEEPTSPRLLRLLREVVRLEIQLENSLLLARADDTNLYMEQLHLADIIQHLAPLWPNLKIDFNDCQVRGDRRALESIFKNIFQNAFHHGEATEVHVQAKSKNDQLSITVTDNGRGFKGEQTQLGKAFFRHNGRSGSGLGLYLSRKLVRQMHGELLIALQKNSFTVELQMNGKL